ncbi:head GIN domain-containing protein [Lewinella sp. 4G2]|uniref:head GIN domain-containing protein n=1 Tax=Lewinella sp. 4G2 TaxID=1803372 RepID=UPI0007B4A815|nr:head GIN domain-containing protein [Lewinella sp. 4G2]OAV43221.1 hypothetical protein A3850_001345 [Lewinella sp. 4G2]
MRILYTLLLVTLFTTASTQAQNWGWNKTIRGNGEVTEDKRDLEDFDGIKACCSMNVEITQGNEFSVLIKAESNLMEYIETKVLGTTLDIGFRDKVQVRQKENIEVYITMPELTKVDASSSADIYTKGSFRGETLRLESSSGSKVRVMFSGEAARIDASSGGEVIVKGTINRLRAEASSGANVDATEATAQEVDADVSSGADIEIHVTEKLRADASSGGSIRYSGTPAQVNSDASSGGKVRKQ